MSGSEHEDQQRRPRFKGIVADVFTSGIHGRRDAEETRKLTLINIFLIVGILILLPFGMNDLLQGLGLLGTIDLAVAAVLLFMFLLFRHTRTARPLTTHSTLGMMTAFFLYLVVTGGVGATGPLWSFTFPLFVPFIVGLKRGVVAVCGFLIVVASLLWLGKPLLLLEYDPAFVTRYLGALVAVSFIALFGEYVRARTHAALERRNRQLEAALAEIRTLSGLIPICAHCKKIRDDQGYWKQIEAYVSDHTDATFSHSICPKCASEFYPELEEEAEADRYQ